MKESYESESRKETSMADEIARKYGITHNGQQFEIPVTLKSGTEITVYLPLWESVPVGDPKKNKNLSLADTKNASVEDLIEAHIKYLPEYDEDPGSFELLRRLKEGRSKKD
jgi:hypothetical protein